MLRLGFDVPKAVVGRFNALQVKSISCWSPDTALKLDCTAMASSEHRCVTELLQDASRRGDPLARGWLVTAAHQPVLPARAGQVALEGDHGGGDASKGVA